MSDVVLRLRVTDDGTIRTVENLGSALGKVGEQAESGASRATQAIDRMKVAAAATAAAAAAAIAAGGALIQRQFSQIDEIAKQARDLNLAGREFVALTGAADLAGLSVENVSASINRLNKAVVEASREGSRQGGIFRALGIDATASRGAMAILGDLSDAFAALPPGIERSQLAVELFGRQAGPRMATFLSQGREELRRSMGQIEAIQGVFDDGASPAVEQFNDNVQLMRGFVNGLQREVAVALLPTLLDASKATVEWGAANRDLLASGAVSFFETLAAVAGRAAGMLAEVAAQQALIAQWYANPSFSGAIDIAGNALQNFLGVGRGTDGAAARTMLDNSLVGPRLPAEEAAARRAAAYAGSVTASQQEAAARQDELMRRLREHMAGVVTETERATQTTESATKATKDLTDEWGRVNTVAAMTPNYVAAMEPAIDHIEVRLINLGDVFADSLASATDAALFRGEFDVFRIFEDAGKASISRMFQEMLREKLSFDTVMKANFLEYLPGVVRQGSDAMARNFGAGAQEMARQAGNTSAVMAGAMRAGGYVPTAQGTAFTVPPGVQSVTQAGGTVIVTDEFGRRFEAPSTQAAAAVAAGAGTITPAPTLPPAGPTIWQGLGTGLAAGSIALGAGGMLGLRPDAQLGLAGGALAGGAVGTMIGSIGGPLGAVIGAGIGLAVAEITDRMRGPVLRSANAGDRVLTALFLDSGVPGAGIDTAAILRAPNRRKPAEWLREQRDRVLADMGYAADSPSRNWRDDPRSPAGITGLERVSLDNMGQALRLLLYPYAAANPSEGYETMFFGAGEAMADLLFLQYREEPDRARLMRRDVRRIFETAGVGINEYLEIFNKAVAEDRTFSDPRDGTPLTVRNQTNGTLIQGEFPLGNLFPDYYMRLLDVFPGGGSGPPITRWVRDMVDPNATHPAIIAFINGLEVFADDVPAAVQLTVEAFRVLSQQTGLIDMEAFARNLQVATDAVTALSGGIDVGARSALGGIITRAEDPMEMFRREAIGGIIAGYIEKAMGSLTEPDGALARFDARLGTALLYGRPEHVSELLDGLLPQLFADIENSLGSAAEVLRALYDSIAPEGTIPGVDQVYMDERRSVRDKMREIRLGAMSPAEQQAEIEAQLGRDRRALDRIADDGILADDERADFERRIASYIGGAERLAAMGSRYARGSVPQRELYQSALDALGLADEYLTFAATSAAFEQVMVGTITVERLVVSASDAGNLVVAGAQTHAGANAIQSAVVG